MQAKDTGVIAGFPVIDFQAELVDGASHDVDSSVLAFEIAARAAFREAMDKAAARLLEPVMKVEVLTPEDYVGDIIGDLNSRRGQVGGMDQRGNARAIDAMVPLANMFGYINTLRSMSQVVHNILCSSIIMSRCHRQLLMKFGQRWHNSVFNI